MHIKGFTLIELLVVVLIIGILASIALPKYTLAVEKAKAAQAISQMGALVNSIERYYSTNSKYPAGFSDFDITFNDTYLSNITRYDKNYIYYQATTINEITFCRITPSKNNIIAYNGSASPSTNAEFCLLIYYEKHPTNAVLKKGTRLCANKASSAIASRLCKSISGSSKLTTQYGFDYYIF